MTDEAEEFAALKRANPDARYTDFYVGKLRNMLARGDAHTTIGPRLKLKGRTEELDFWAAGREQVAEDFAREGIAPHHRVIDYGCGSLRLGAHYIDRLDAGNYFGLDVTTDFIDIGRGLVGAELLEEKRPHLAAISLAAIDEAAAFGADFVFSNLVAYHIHPDEQEAYFGNLRALCAKPGCVLFFDASVSREPKAAARRQWSWPIDHYQRLLTPMKLALSSDALGRLNAKAASNDTVRVVLRFVRQE